MPLVLRLCTGRSASRNARRTARVVGLRHLIQAAGTLAVTSAVLLARSDPFS